MIAQEVVTKNTPCREFFRVNSATHHSSIGMASAIVLLLLSIVILSFLPEGKYRVAGSLTLILVLSAFLLSCVHWIFVEPLQGELITVSDEFLQYRSKTTSQVIFDNLTGTLNRWALESLVLERFEECIADGSEVCAVMLDVDHFKLVNDVHGHFAGDKALRCVSAAIRRLVQRDDMVVRFGGDEFLLVLPRTSLAGATLLADRIRAAVAKEDVSVDAGDVRLTVSLGVVTSRQGIRSLTDLIQLADQALYDAKESGRNCTRSFRV